MTDDQKNVEERLTALEVKIASSRSQTQRRTIRKRSKTLLWGLPIYDIACGPDPTKGERRGYARGILAIGDLATGVLAFGGIAGGIVAIGGLAVGVIGVGGCSVGIAAAVGGVAVGGVALGGVAIGLYAIGGVAIHYFV